jgi:streptogramin lyase
MIGKRLGCALLLALAGSVVWAAPAFAQTAITEFTTGVSGPTAMVNGVDGNVWFINAGGIARITSSGQVTTYKAGLDPGATPYDLSNGPDGDLWFTDNGAKGVGYITSAGAIHEFSAPSGELPLQIVAGSDGNLWFYSAGATPSVVKMTPAGAFTATPMPAGGEIEDDMVLGPDGDIWFSDMGTTSIGKIAPSGIIAEYPLTAGAIPTNITVGPDGNLWFSDNNGAIGRISTSGSIREFSAGLQTGADPDAITAGPDGNVWFTDQYANKRAIGRITPSGQITEFTNGLNQDLPLDITAAADGNLWVPQASMGASTPSAVAQITPSGQITEITTGVHPAGLQDGDSILAATNGSLWFTDNVSPNAVGQIIIPPEASTGAATAITSASVTLSGTVTPLAAATTVSIQYGTTPAFGSVTSAGTLAAGTSVQSVSAGLAGLPPASTIYYRIVATNAAASVGGMVESFQTSPAPPIPTTQTARTTQATLDNQSITVTAPAASICTANTAKLPLTLNSTVIKGSRKPKLSFSNAVLYLDKGVKHTTTKTVRRHAKKLKLKVTIYKPNATVRKLPSSPNLKLAGLKSGQHTLKAIFSYMETVTKHRRKSKQAVTKTLTTKFLVC